MPDPLQPPTLGGAWGPNGQWENQAEPGTPEYNSYQQQLANYNRQKNDPNSPYNQANALGAKEQMLLGRQAPGIGQVMTGGLEGARGNQMGALGAQQALMAGPSLAGMRASQQFGQAQQAMMGTRNPNQMRAAMMAGGQQLGAAAGAAGNAVGQEWMQGQKGIAGALNTLGQGDIASQQAIQKLQAQQQQLNLTQRQQNLTAGQGYEQNYYDLQNAYTQAAQASLGAQYQKQQDEKKQQLQLIGAGASAVPFIGGMFGGAATAGANASTDATGANGGY